MTIMQPYPCWSIMPFYVTWRKCSSLVIAMPRCYHLFQVTLSSMALQLRLSVGMSQCYSCWIIGRKCYFGNNGSVFLCAPSMNVEFHPYCFCLSQMLRVCRGPLFKHCVGSQAFVDAQRVVWSLHVSPCSPRV